MQRAVFVTCCTLMLGVIASISGGCSSAPKFPTKLSLPNWHETGSPTKIVAIWEPVIRDQHGDVQRGFAARVMFYDNQNKKALRVRGAFEVYCFDEEGREASNITPTKVVKFHPTDMKLLESESKMFGTSYTIWVPWDEATEDAPEKNVSLFVKFKCENGETVVSHQAKVILPGANTKKEDVADVKYENPFINNMERQTAALNDIAQKRRENPEGMDLAWNGQLDERVVSRETRPEMMVTTTITGRPVNRDGAPHVTTSRAVAATNPAISPAMRQQANVLVADARQTMLQNQQQAMMQSQMTQNQSQQISMPSHQLQQSQQAFQSSQQSPLGFADWQANASQNLQPNMSPNTQQNLQMQPASGMMNRQATLATNPPVSGDTDLIQSFSQWQQQNPTSSSVVPARGL